jgi:hypothetical protein
MVGVASTMVSPAPRMSAATPSMVLRLEQVQGILGRRAGLGEEHHDALRRARQVEALEAQRRLAHRRMAEPRARRRAPAGGLAELT